MKKKMKSKGYAKGGAKMMKARGGKMMKSKGYAKGGAKMMKAMGGRMMKSKGYAKGGTKMMRASGGGFRQKGSGTISEKEYKAINKPKRGMPNMSIANFKKLANQLGYTTKKK